MYCAQCNGLKSRVALAVGNDLSEAELVLLEKQLKNCEQCRSQYEELQKSYDALQNQFDSAPVPALQDSVWPKVSAKIVARRRRNRPTQFNFLLPTLTTVACCLALLLVTNSPQPEQNIFPPRPGSIHPVPVGVLGDSHLNAVNSSSRATPINQWNSSENSFDPNYDDSFSHNVHRSGPTPSNHVELRSVKF